MTIVNSTIVSQVTQKDGRIAVDERHIDDVGQVWNIGYLAAAADNLSALLAAHASSLDSNLRIGEILKNVDSVMTNGSLAVPTFQYSTQNQNLTALRAFYAMASKLQAIMVGDFLSSLTDGQLQSIFSMTAGQVTTLRANKLTPAANTASAIRAAAGQ